MKKKTHPTFSVQNFGRTKRKRVKERWRRPRGLDNKKRRKVRQMGALPNVGYKNPPCLRGIHPCGKREVLVCNITALEGLKDVAVRIGSSVSKRKKETMRKKAKEMKLKVLN